MRSALPLLLLLAAGCAPALVVPAVGTSLKFDLCYSTKQDVHVYRYGTAKCPPVTSVEARAENIERRYNVKLAGTKVFFVNAFVECAGGPVYGCASDKFVTIQAGYAALGVLEHELAHVAIDKLGSGYDIRHFDLDNPPSSLERNPQ